MLHVKQRKGNAMLVGLMFPRALDVTQTLHYSYVFFELIWLWELGHQSWYTKVWELARSFKHLNLDINSYDDSSASKQLIKFTVVEKYTSDWLVNLQGLTTNPYYKHMTRLKMILGILLHIEASKLWDTSSIKRH